MAHRCCFLLLLGLLVAPAAVSASLPHDNYLHLVEQQRRLLGSQTPKPKSACNGKKMGAPLDGQYIIMFDSEKVSSVSEGISEVRKTVQQATAAAAAAAAGFPASASQPTTPADPFSIIQPVSSVSPVTSSSSSTSTSTSSSTSSAGGRRLQAVRRRRHRLRRPPMLGAVVKVPPGPQGEALVKTISQASVVTAAVQDVCVKALDSQERFNCLPATMLSSSILQPVASAAWEGCLTPNTFLAWWGERCGADLNMVQWTGVYAFDKNTGARLAGCVKQRPSAGGSVGSDLTFWLGGCGVPPAAVPSLSSRVCKDPYIADTLMPAEDQGCMSYNFTDATQTAQLFHPVPGCGTKQPVNMTYRGQRCTGNSGASSSTGVAGVLWQSAEPTAGSGLDPVQCKLQRRTGTTPDDTIFNMDWFGSCGVPPARVQYIPRSECPAPPPPVPPPPPPRPDDQKALDREPMKSGETAPSGILRTLAVTANPNVSSGYDTVSIMRQFTVAVLDSGVDCYHRDLNVVFNKSFVVPTDPADPLSDKKGCYDVYDHGTNVAGVIGAVNNGYGVLGILPNIPIASLKILDWNGEAPASNILVGVLWLMQTSLDGVNPNPDNATNAEMLDIEAVNMSFGVNYNVESAIGIQVCNAMKMMLDHGILMAAAAGNEQQPLNQMLPAACESVIAVTALSQGNGTIDVTQNAADWFSNFLNLDPNSPSPPTPFKANLTVSAPGEDVYSTCFQQNQPYCLRTGTSQATPHVVGMLARCISGGRCTAHVNGTQSAMYAANKWATYNLEHPDYGYAKDPIRYSKSIFYWGYLTCADVW